MLKTAVVMPMPSANATMAIALTNFCRVADRSA
jgi:hypothetical protein